jgi:ParB family chromosome partitioning protein
MARHKGLGRGLDALLGGGQEPRDDDRLAQLMVTALRPGKYQPRTRMDEASLAELAESIKARGVIQPVVVRTVAEGQYEILAGERRWRAAKLAGLDRLPAVIREVPDEAALGIGLIENIQREDLNPIEEAAGLKRLIEEFRLTHEEVARAIGRSRVGVTNLLRLLELAPAVQALVQEGRIDMGHARALLAVSKARQVELAHQIAEKGLSVRDAERLVQEQSAAPRAAASGGPKLDADGRRLEEELSEVLGASVHLKPRRAGRGSVVIDYSSLDELEGLVERFKRA